MAETDEKEYRIINEYGFEDTFVSTEADARTHVNELNRKGSFDLFENDASDADGIGRYVRPRPGTYRLIKKGSNGYDGVWPGLSLLELVRKIMKITDLTDIAPGDTDPITRKREEALNELICALPSGYDYDDEDWTDTLGIIVHREQ